MDPVDPQIAYLADDDAKLAQQLAEEEEETYAEFLKTVEEQDDGIVFSVSINAADNTLEDGSPAHPDDIERFELWRELFEQTSDRRITKFHWFASPLLERRFENARSILESMGRPAKEELMLFHGTPEANFNSILKSGLRVGGTYDVPLATGCASGVGIYLSERAGSAIGYTRGANRIFACRVIPGKVTTNIEQVRKIPKLEPGAEKCDSYFGPYVKGNIYVVRCSDLVLPCYMIEFENAQTAKLAPAVTVAAAKTRVGKRARVSTSKSVKAGKATSKDVKPRRLATSQSSSHPSKKQRVDIANPAHGVRARRQASVRHR